MNIDVSNTLSDYSGMRLNILQWSMMRWYWDHVVEELFWID